MRVIDPVRRHVLGAADLDDLRTRTRAIEAWPAGSHVWGHYAEETPHGTAICRTENVSACEPGIAALVDGELAALASRRARRARGRVQGQVELQATRRRRLQPTPGSRSRTPVSIG